MLTRTVALATFFVCAFSLSHGNGDRFLARDTEFVEPGVVPETASTNRYPLPTALKCITNIAIQYMIVYLALAIIRTYHEIRGTPKGSVEAALAAAATTLTLGPMLCVLFIACRLRVVWLSQGQGDPQVWVQYCMCTCTYAVSASTLVVLIIPLLIGHVPKVNKKTGDLEADMGELEEHKVSLYALTALRYLILLGMYEGIAVTVGMCIYQPPPGTWPGNKIPSPSSAVMCTMIMSVAFFMVFLFVATCKSFTELTGRSAAKLEQIMLGAARTMESAPMLCILFLAARMQALQMDPVNGAPQKWAQGCFYMCTFAVIIQAFLAIAVPFVIASELKRENSSNVTIFKAGVKPIIGYVLAACRHAMMLCMYGGLIAVIVSIFTIQHPKGSEYTVPVSPALQCVINLACQFFFVYLLLWVMISVQELTGFKIKQTRCYAALEAARATVMFAPMLSLLFVAARMWALQTTDNKGAPQAWAQDGMFISTWAMLICVLMCLLSGLFMWAEVDEDGNVVNTFDNLWVAIPILTIRYLAMFLMYLGIVIVMMSIFLITPATANGRGSMQIAA
eukprot:gnl/TRDRNA2_/TRDRNA2_152244_c0_seq1.p1 gnl/TRDRNA2_/TRDRNA2_152244_c0~~gnl/TRDRNA2_/TRDRNA2_152244_c0_seq1.p1  ORF type:complete len:564 (+),score=70.28 gnl/TRDRNA2_/TRDRNA2_152244_c0_seq1:74-1765(+)